MAADDDKQARAMILSPGFCKTSTRVAHHLLKDVHAAKPLKNSTCQEKCGENDTVCVQDSLLYR